jgi:hypothetical protein
MIKEILEATSEFLSSGALLKPTGVEGVKQYLLKPLRHRGIYRLQVERSHGPPCAEPSDRVFVTASQRIKWSDGNRSDQVDLVRYNDHQ